MKLLSQQYRKNIISLLQHNKSTRQIADQLHVSHSTVSRIKKKILPDTQKSSGGRPHVLTEHDERSIIRSISSGHCNTATEAQKNLREHQKINISAQTVRNILKKNGMKAYVKAKKPLITQKHKKQHLEFAKKYKEWTVEDWRNVIFSDETKINRFGADGRKWCWKKPGSALQPNHVKPTVKFGGGSLMVWGCMTAHGVGNLVKIEGTMDSKLYCQILQEDLLESIEYHGLESQDIVFQHDNDPKHSARVTKQWLQDAEIEVLDWPPQSPDLNPIEHLWEDFKRQLSDYQRTPTSVKELWERAGKVWYKTSQEKCRELIDSMPQRVAAVLKAKGGYTKY